MNKDIDHDIADLLVRERNSRHLKPCRFENCWCKPKSKLISKLAEEQSLEVIDLKISDKPVASTKPHTVLDTLRESLWVAENEGQIDGNDFKEAHKWLEACESDLELLRNLMKIIDYHMVAVGDMVGDRENIAIIRMKVRKRLKEIRDANIHRDRVPEDRHSELLRIGQGNLGGSYRVDGCQTGRFRSVRQTSQQPHPFSKSCTCPTCRRNR